MATPKSSDESKEQVFFIMTENELNVEKLGPIAAFTSYSVVTDLCKRIVY